MAAWRNDYINKLLFNTEAYRLPTTAVMLPLAFSFGRERGVWLTERDG